MAYIKELIAAIRRLHRCDATYVETVPVTETFQGETVWQGDVEIFNIRGHPKAKRAYAWAHAAGKHDRGKRYVTVLELPPVDSPKTAVQAAILQEIRSAREEIKESRASKTRKR